MVMEIMIFGRIFLKTQGDLGLYCLKNKLFVIVKNKISFYSSKSIGNNDLLKKVVIVFLGIFTCALGFKSVDLNF